MKLLRLVLVILLSFSLTGCIQKYEYTEDQDNAMAEYMAGQLLDNDKDYNQELVPVEELQSDSASTSSDTQNPDNPTAEVTDTPDSPDASGESTDTNTEGSDEQTDYTIAELIGTPDFNIQYTGIKLTDVYPENMDDAYFSVSSREGHQLLVIKFSVKNQSKKNKKFNLSEAAVKYQLDIGGEMLNKPEFTVLENDLQYINMTIKAGEASEVILIYDIPKDSDTSNMNLIISKDNKSKIIELK